MEIKELRVKKSFSKEKLNKLLEIADSIARLSKDPSTKVGAIILGCDGEGGPWGYNGACRGSSADEHPSIAREAKLRAFEHAERNAIYAAARQGFATKGCTLICTHFPCIDCARGIVQSGIVRVICRAPGESFKERWQASISAAEELFMETGVELLVVS